MKLDLTDMLYALSFALDEVETELLGIDTGHGKRVTCLALLMGEEAGFREEEMRDFAGCCILHDNALTEFIHEELINSEMPQALSVQVSDIIDGQGTKMNHYHCVIGEQNIRLMPFRTDVKNIILYHHENADGSGALGMTASETPLKAQILHLADIVDMKSRLGTMTKAEFEELRRWVQSKAGTLFSKEAVELFLKAVDYDKVVFVRNKGVLPYLREKVKTTVCDYTDEEIRNIVGLFAKIVDYKSEFTQTHSTGVAEKSEIMAKYYGYDAEKAIRYYFAGALHDIGKLVVVNDILEKPGKLTENEFAEMKNHAAATHYILGQIKEISDIVKWAGNHHEKLNGNGYPQGLTADELSFEERLMACIDIYQALTEKRPYKDGMSHEKSISIMMEMAQRNELDERIVRDMDRVMGDQVPV
ncbi:MAG: HD domain-containing protein [Lachnospiraceae bacterium]|nr:HD domain-containing protein [Lachnospiraceae bacterium]